MSEETRDYRQFQRELNDLLHRAHEPQAADGDEAGTGEGVPVEEAPEPPQFDMKPEELLAYLDRYVVKQDAAKEIIATKVCTHFNRLRLGEERERFHTDIKNNIIMVGPTGVGKTYIIRLIARKIGVPFVKADATKFSETGYVGGDVEDLARELVERAGGDMERARTGIIYIDEIDKIAATGRAVGPDVSRSGVQRNLLKLMEETEVDLKAPHDLASQMESVMQFQRSGKVEKKRINTKDILFIVSGAFAGLDEIIARRLHRRDIGFSNDRPGEKVKETALLRRVRSEDLIAYGFESEFIGRLPVVAVLEPLEEEDLYRILANPESSVMQAKRLDFRAYEIDLEFEDGALHRLARLAHEERTGARGLVSVLERTLIQYERRLPSTGVRRLTVTEAMVDNPAGPLADVIFHGSVDAFREDFHAESGVRLVFEDEASAALRRMSEEQGIAADMICRGLFRDYALGLKLIDIDTFRVTTDVLAHPKHHLDDTIKAYYGRRDAGGPDERKDGGGDVPGPA